MDLRFGQGGQTEIVTSSRGAAANGKVQRGVRASISDASGTYSFRGLPPGQYFIAAWEDLSGMININQNLQFLGHFEKEAKTIKLAEGEKVSIDLTAIPKAKITAEVAKMP